MSKVAVWLEMAGDRVLVDLGSRSEAYWRGMGYMEPGLAVETSFLGEPLIVEAPVKKARAKKVVTEA